MNDNEDYLSDSDQSDEDFCPEKEVASGSEDNNSIESSNDDEDSNIEDDDDDSDTKHKKKSNKKTIKNKKMKINRRSNKKFIIKNDNDNAEIYLESKSNNLNNDEKDDDKQKSDKLWASFLSDVSQTTTTTTSTVTKSKTIENNDKSDELSKKLSIKTKEEDNSEKSNKLLLTQTENGTDKKIKITEILDFAGEEIQIEKEISVNEMKNLSKLKPSSIANATIKNNVIDGNVQTTAKTSLSKNISNVVNPLKRSLSSMGGGSGSSSSCGGGSGNGGFGSILNRIGKKTKISVLEKSKLDWDKFKQNEGLKEELQTYNKGKDGYLERQDFLQRTDLRQFEIESSLRKSNRCSKNNA